MSDQTTRILCNTIKDLRLEVAGLHKVTESLWEAHEIRGGHRYALSVAPSASWSAKESDRITEVVNAELKRLREMFCRVTIGLG